MILQALQYSAGECKLSDQGRGEARDTNFLKGFALHCLFDGLVSTHMSTDRRHQQICILSIMRLPD